ncbi:hypothetical protein IQ243_11835 [Nostocales cyanobacterium LEGE 11386]|nr:hypothetical protein [Nostocales cyanobacterium LEGE 11386]
MAMKEILPSGSWQNLVFTFCQPPGDRLTTNAIISLFGDSIFSETAIFDNLYSSDASMLTAKIN